MIKKKILGIILACMIALSVLPTTTAFSAALPSLTIQRNGYDISGDLYIGLSYQTEKIENCVYSSANTSVASVGSSTGKITTKSVGHTRIAARTSSGTIKGIITITVSDRSYDEETGAWLIKSAADLDEYSTAVNKGLFDLDAYQDCDIVYNENLFNEDGTLTDNTKGLRTWTPICKNSTNEYRGYYYGMGHTIKGLYSDNNYTYRGFIGNMRSGAVHDLNIEDCYFSGGSYMGGICGYSYYGFISNCSVSGNFKNIKRYVGGICGYNEGGTIVNSCMLGNVSAKENYVGAICGYNDGNISNCIYAPGTFQDGSGFAQNGVGVETLETSTPDISGQTDIKPLEQFVSGEVAMLLQQGTTVKSTFFNGNSWGQNLGNSQHPYAGNKKVYYLEKFCPRGGAYGWRYSNSGDSVDPHEYENGVCRVCGALAPDFAPFKDNYFEIDTQEELLGFVKYVNDSNPKTNVKLVSDVDITGIDWESIPSYDGIFDGNGYTITGLGKNTTVPDERRGGFIVTLEENGIIKNVSFKDADIFLQGANRSSTVAGCSYGEISGCIVENSILQCGNHIGLAGIVGENHGAVNSCGVINTTLRRRYGGSGSQKIGGIAETNYGTVKNCYSYGCSIISGSVRGGIVASGTKPESSYYYTTSELNSTVDGIYAPKEDFTSGKTTYFLNGGDGIQTIWYQTVGNDLPRLTGDVVYCVANEYKNTEPTGEIYIVSCDGDSLNVKTTGDTTASVVVASYDANGKFINLAIEDEHSFKGGSDSMQLSETLETINANSIQVMILDSVESMKPLCGAVTVFKK